MAKVDRWGVQDGFRLAGTVGRYLKDKVNYTTQEFIVAAQRAAKEYPNDWVVFYSLGARLFDIGQHALALEANWRCVELKPTDIRSTYALATIYNCLSRADWTDAQIAWLEDRNRRIGFPSVAGEREVARRELEKLGMSAETAAVQAMRWFERCLELRPDAESRAWVEQHLSTLYGRYPAQARHRQPSPRQEPKVEMGGSQLPAEYEGGATGDSQGNSLQASGSSWMGLSGAVGGCLLVLSTLSFFLCIAAFALGSLVRFDEYGNEIAVLPPAVAAAYVLAFVTLLAAIAGGTALAVRAFGHKGVSTSQALQATFVGAFLPLRYIIGALQGLVALSICVVLFWPLVSIWWPIGALLGLSIVQGVLLLTIRLLSGPGIARAIIESEQ